MKLTLPDGTKKEFKKSVTGKEVAESIGKKLAKDALAVEVNGSAQDLSTPINKDASINILTFSTKEGKSVFRHSTAHVLAHAIKNLYPKAKPTIGPPIENGFYYDFDDLQISENDFAKIEAEMKKIVDQNLEFEKVEWTINQAKKAANKFKFKIAEQVHEKGEQLTAYKDGDFIDLCEGPHVPSTGYIKAFKLTALTAAYWRGDAKNKQLTRIYGTSFSTDKELQEYIKQREEAEKRDHAKLGKQLGLFVHSDVVGKGLPLLAPKGATIKRILTRFVEDEEIKRGYQFTDTPVLAKTDLYEVSGHLAHYREHMFIAKVGDEEFAMRPMTCPHQYIIYKSQGRSYRELPMRLAETASLFRNEQSGELHGLIRIRQFTLADAHIICRENQLKEEFIGVIKLIQYIMENLGLKDYWYRYSKWDPENKEKYIDNPEAWEKSQALLKEILEEMKLQYEEADGEAAFYGPKLDIQMKNVFGKEDTMFTVQLDFSAAERFDMKYTDENNQEVRPMVIHRSSIGCYERTIAILIEHYAGKFPMWLSPEQVRVLTVSEKFNEGAGKLVQKLKEEGFRATLDPSVESISKKVRNAQLDQVNYILVFGEKEQKEKALQVRTRDNKVYGPEPVDKFIKDLHDQVAQKK